MRPESQLLLEDKVLQQASQWFAILQSENISAEEQQNWRDWLSLDPAHQLAWEQIEAIQAGFNQGSKLIHISLCSKADNTQVRNL